MQRLQTTLSTSRFLLQRLIRLLPILIPGVLIGALIECWRPGVSDPFSHAKDIVLALLLECAAIPWPFPTSMEQTIFPINGPVWSLFFEIIANILFVVVAKSAYVRPASFILTIAGGLGTTAFIMAFGTIDLGYSLVNWPGGFPRVFYSFFVGVLLNGIQVRPPIISTWVFPCVLVIIFMLPQSPGYFGAFIDLTIVLTIFPLLIILAAGSRPGPTFLRLCSLAGAVSYPLYAIHYPIIRGICSILARHPVSVPLRLGVAGLSISGLIMLSWLVYQFYDRPFRRALTRRILPNEMMDRGRQDEIPNSRMTPKPLAPQKP